MKNMLNYRIVFGALFLLILASCDDFLDINENPNQATSVPAKLVLPNALTNTASVFRQYNTAGSWISGYTVNAGGFGGWGSIVTYNFTPNDHNALWQNTYDDLFNYTYIIQNSTTPELAYFNAAARVMQAFDFQMLVDFYGNIPYSDALKGAEIVTPKYDQGDFVYQQLINSLDDAIATFKNATAADALGTADVLFNGNTDKWIRFANSLKLKLLIRISGVASLQTFVNSKFSSFDVASGFMQDDALVNPGYLATDGKQNPSWAVYHSNAAGAQSGAGRSAIPSTFVYSFYNGNKISDNARGTRTFRSFPTTPRGQLGELDNNPNAITDFIAWYVGTGSGANASNTIGLFKGRTAGQPIMLKAESDFLLAEAHLKGFLAGSAATAFDAGILASITYLAKDINNQVVGTPATDLASYKTNNAGNKLVDYAACVNDTERLEAIITQKYIANNFVSGHDAWSEFRRTGYPRIVNGSAVPSETFASILSNSTRADKLPVRVLYAATELQLNSGNVPGNINQFTNLIFWQPQ